MEKTQKIILKSGAAATEKPIVSLGWQRVFKGADGLYTTVFPVYQKGSERLIFDREENVIVDIFKVTDGAE